ncbi:MAG: Mut7-C RNAse domain-containing protein [Deltaproteobacteria bacterium]|nr:MAG: Mut7-C RNAse domain-containing protein [Deltaproteobacteria bacterium]
MAHSGLSMERLAVDRMLGKLAKWLRALGCDVVYLSQAKDEEILTQLQDGRILVTRDRRAETWQKHGKVFQVRANDPKEQLREVFHGLHLSSMYSLQFSRCIRCNRILTRVGREQVRDLVPEHIWQTHRRFHMCDGCDRVYWSGTHSDRMLKRLEELFAQCEEPG